ncbi:MAG: DUF2490 domain-containing protein [Salibacteraceae bacterium]
MNRFVLFIGLIAISLNTFSQKTAEERVGAWYMHFGNYKVAKNWSLFTEYHLRMYDPVGKWQQMIGSVGITRHFNNNTKAGLGYAYLPTESFEKGAAKKTAQEHRIWQTYFLNNQMGRLAIRHRYQLEERFLSTSTGNSAYKTRIRYQLMLTLPLNNDKKVDKTFYLIAANEFFLHLEQKPFDQNRFIVGAGYKVNEWADLQFGYMRQSFNTFSYDRLMLSWTINPDFTKKQ